MNGNVLPKRRCRAIFRTDWPSVGTECPCIRPWWHLGMHELASGLRHYSPQKYIDHVRVTGRFWELRFVKRTLGFK
jgi:hypothetical protein